MATTFANVTPVELEPVEAPTEELELPDNLDTVDDVIDVARDCYEKLQGLASKVGLSFPGDFPEGGIAEWFIEPVTGDFNRIAAGGLAAGVAGDALQAVGDNILANNAKLALSWTGDASVAFALNTSLYAAVAHAAGFLLAQTKLVFDGIATVSRECGEALGRLLGELVDLCASMVEFLVKKFSGALASVGSWILDALSGFDDVKALYSNITEAKGQIEALLGFKDEVEAYYEVAKSSFDVFSQLRDLAALLPALANDPSGNVDDLAGGLAGLRESMQEQQEAIDGLRETIGDDAQDAVDGVDADAPEAS
ncbi:hypothetical protein GCM10028777_21530 [Angustibacter speluncae]